MKTGEGSGLTVVSLFTGAMGLDLGLEQAGFRTTLAVEADVDAARTIRANRPEIEVIERRIEDVETAEILEKAGLEVGGATVLAGGPACQTFSTAGKRRSLGTPAGLLVYEFMRVVEEMRPEFFVMENVKGLLSAAVRHRPLRLRGPGHPVLDEEEELGSAFARVAGKLRELGYYIVFDVLNAADFGVPQTRQRLVIVGSRDCRPVVMPVACHSGDGSGHRPPWTTLGEAIGDLSGQAGEGLQFVPSRQRYLKDIPAGGNWRDLPEGERAAALGGAFRSWGGRSGFLRRLAWDQPCPTLNTHPDHKATALCHPDELRPLNIPEYLRLQGFPDDWRVEGRTNSKYRQLGNAVPVGLARAVGTAVLTARGRRPDQRLRGRLECHNLQLLDRLASRLRTRLNPPRMRETAEQGAVAEWAGSGSRVRDDASAYVPPHLVGAVGKAKVAKAIVEKLRCHYGTPDLGNYSDPVDELFFIMLSRRTTGPSFERVFRQLKEWAVDWESFACRDVHEVAGAIGTAGLGEQRAGQMIEAARRLIQDFGHVTLDALADESDASVEGYLTSLPGVGVKTAKCVMMFSMGRQVLPVDAHVARVSERLGLVNRSRSGARTHEVLEAVVRPEDRHDFHVNAVAHGRMACRERDPKCGDCPVRNRCNYWGQRMIEGNSSRATPVTDERELTKGGRTENPVSDASSVRRRDQLVA